MSNLEQRIEQLEQQVNDGIEPSSYGLVCQNRLADCADHVWEQTHQQAKLLAREMLSDFLNQIRKMERLTRRRQLLSLLLPFLRNSITKKVHHDCVQLGEDLKLFLLKLEQQQQGVIKHQLVLRKIGEHLQTQCDELLCHLQAIDNAAQHASLAKEWEERAKSLKTSQTMASQLQAQLQLMGDNASRLSDQLSQVLASTLPLWKNQMGLVLGTQEDGCTNFRQLYNKTLSFTNTMACLLK